MASSDRTVWVIPPEAGATDYGGVPRTITVRLVNGEVLLYASTAEDNDLAEARSYIRMPNDVAEQLGYHLQAGAETNRLRGRS